MKTIFTILKTTLVCIGLFLFFYTVVAFITWDIYIYKTWYYGFFHVVRVITVVGICLGLITSGLVSTVFNSEDDEGPQMG